MKDRKREYRVFTIADWEREQDYLRKRHGEGWKFTGLHTRASTTLSGASRRTWCTSWITTRRGSSTRTSMCRCSGLRLGVHPGLCGVQLFPQACVPDAGGKWRKSSAMTSPRLEMMRRMFLGRYTPLFIILVLLILAKPVPPAAQQGAGRPGACGAVPHLAGGLRLGVCLLCPPVLEAQAPVREISIGPLPEKSRNNRPWFSRGGCHPFVRLLGGAAGGERASLPNTPTPGKTWG